MATESPETPAAPAAANPPPPTPAPIADVRAVLATVADTLMPGADVHVAKLLAVELAGVSAPLLADAAKAILDSPAYAIFRRPAVQPGSVEARAALMKAAAYDHGSLAGAKRNPDGSLVMGTGAFDEMQAQPGTAQARAIEARQAQARQAAVERKIQENPGMNAFMASTSLKIESDREALRMATGIIMRPSK